MLFRVSIFLLFLSFNHNLLSQQFLPKSEGEIVVHSYFTLSYNEKHEQANWVHYKLTPSFLNGNTARTDKFLRDPKVSTSSAGPNSYRGSGYDRGHLAPAGDMKFNSISMSESFYMSNISPQDPSFNRGIWKKLESLVRAWGEESEIYVTTAGILNSNNLGSVGINSVTIPAKFYKVIYSPSKQKMIGFVLNNRKSYNALSTFVVSVDSIEELTGIDFYSDLPDEIENKLESEISKSRWDFTKKTSSRTNASSKSQSQQCNGIAKSTGNQCRNKTTNSNGYCYLHQNQSDGYVKPKVKKTNYVGRCNATTKKGTQCKRNASSGSRYCWQHQ